MSELVEEVAEALFFAKWIKLERKLIENMWAEAKGDDRTADQWRDAKVAVEAYGAWLTENGYRVLSPGHAPMPANRSEAAAMALIGETWLKQNSPPTKTVEEGHGNPV